MCNLQKLENICLYQDTNSEKNKEPGIYHSYMICLATTLKYIAGEIDPVQLMGASGFAFRIFVNEIMCPSAMSMFSFKDVLPSAMEQAGFHCIYFQRMWDESQQEAEKREQAHQAIVKGIERGRPAIVWDIFEAEWGLITGYDNKKQAYSALSYKGDEVSLPFEKLGQNGINILSVAIPDKPNHRSPEEVVFNSLTAAVTHAEGKEWIDDRPTYQNGLAAFDLWASIFEKWAWLMESGKSKNIGVDIFSFARYYAGHHLSARCYARGYLHKISKEDNLLKQASEHYRRVTYLLKPIWTYFQGKKEPKEQELRAFSQSIKEAGEEERKAIGLIKQHLSTH
jgi:hypothetical protein